jgi:cysteinyl-tRNA synthetase
MTLALYNSLTRQVEPFVPQDPNRVTMYVCGPTVYNPPHVGNARAAVVFDLLYRVLKERYPKVIYARNITDVDDKINAQAREEGSPIEVIARRYATAYHEDIAALNVLEPSVEPRATEHIDTIIAMIEGLIAGGHAYVAEQHVLFHVPAFADYGCLSGRNRDDMIAGARVEVAPFKKDPADFVLWKPSTPDLPGWPSPWGRGRPGWHIECSAMIERHLGRTIDIHGGGNDLKFPHHENEIAQSCSIHRGAPLSRYWVHNGMLEFGGEKMAKSVGNVLSVRDLLQRFPGETIRYGLLMARYREPLNWTEQHVREAHAALHRLYGALERLQGVDADKSGASPAFAAAIEDDLNTPEALAVLHREARAANTATARDEQAHVKGRLLAAGRQLGILQLRPAQWFGGASVSESERARIEGLVTERAQARKAGDFAAADRARNELRAMGVQLLDRADGTTQWRITAAHE